MLKIHDMLLRMPTNKIHWQGYHIGDIFSVASTLIEYFIFKFQKELWSCLTNIFIDW